MTKRTSHGDHRSVMAAIGFTVKSGWASAVVVTGTIGALQVLENRRVELSDPSDPDCRQPYHAGFGTARRSGPELTRLVRSVRRFGRRAVTTLLRQCRDHGYDLRAAGIVVGSLIDPESIANQHIRIHALEGQLFRRVVEEALAQSRLPCSIFRQRDLYALATKKLGRPEAELRARIGAAGAGVHGSWRVEQKAAALAAYLVLAVP